MNNDGIDICPHRKKGLFGMRLDEVESRLGLGLMLKAGVDRKEREKWGEREAGVGVSQ